MNSVHMLTTAMAGTSRIVGFGIEAVNTTADLYKQGAVTCYRMPQAPSETSIEMTDAAVGATFIGVRQAVKIRKPPSTAAEALLLGGSTQWAASDGAYVVVPLASIENPLGNSRNRMILLSANDDIATGEYVMTNDAALATPANLPPLPTLLKQYTTKFVPYCNCGIYFTGLSNQSTIRVKVKVYAERAPTQADASLAVLATPSAAYDPKALALYSAIMQRMPIAVPVHMNAAGDWWSAILKTIAAAAPVFGSLFPGIGTAVGAAVGVGAAGAATAIDAAMKASDRTEKSKKSAAKPKPSAPIKRRVQQ